jgi:hypothetical protein
LSESEPTQRRKIDFDNWRDVSADINQLIDGGYTATGNWNLQQCCDHLNDWLGYTLDGYPKPSIPVRILFVVLRKVTGERAFQTLLKDRTMKPGLPTAPKTVHKDAHDDVTAVMTYQATIDRFESYDGPIHSSPLLGSMTKSEAEQLHHVHAALHLSFLWPRDRSV